MEAQRQPVPQAIGVVGAGTMGAGIAQLAAQAGSRALMFDPAPGAVQQGVQRIGAVLARSVERGRLTEAEAEQVSSRLEPVSELRELAACGLVIEAAPERIELKLSLFEELARHVSSECVLATNTSSLSVTEIAAGTPVPERVVGMHFFNPPPLMKLLEVVAGEQSGPQALAVARATGEAMGKTVIDAADVAGFLVNRVNRPFSLVSLRLLGERLASVEQIDRIVRLEGGFRLGPFELQDLIGLDVNHAVAEAFQRQSYGEARYQPSPLQAKMIAAGRLGRKAGRGWYEYDASGGGDSRTADPELPEAGGGDGRMVALPGELPVFAELADAAAAAGFAVKREPVPEAWLTLWCGDREPDGAGPQARLLHDSSLHGSRPAAAGFHVVPPMSGRRLIEVTRTPQTDPESFGRLCEFVRCLGRHPEEVGDGPGLVLGRLIAALVNEAAFLLGEGNGTAEDVDAGMTLGLNHPRGPVAWSASMGVEHVVGILDALRRELGEERYRVAPLLRRRLALGERALA